MLHCRGLQSPGLDLARGRVTDQFHEWPDSVTSGRGPPLQRANAEVAGVSSFQRFPADLQEPRGPTATGEALPAQHVGSIATVDHNILWSLAALIILCASVRLAASIKTMVRAFGRRRIDPEQPDRVRGMRHRYASAPRNVMMVPSVAVRLQ